MADNNVKNRYAALLESTRVSSALNEDKHKEEYTSKIRSYYNNMQEQKRTEQLKAQGKSDDDIKIINYLDDIRREKAAKNATYEASKPVSASSKAIGNAVEVGNVLSGNAPATSRIIDTTGLKTLEERRVEKEAEEKARAERKAADRARNWELLKNPGNIFDVINAAGNLIAPDSAKYISAKVGEGITQGMAEAVDTAVGVGDEIGGWFNGKGPGGGFTDYLNSGKTQQDEVAKIGQRIEADRTDNPDNAFVNFLADAGYNAGRMAPATYAAYVAGVFNIPATAAKIISGSTIGLNSFTAGTKEALKNGATKSEAIAYGTSSAIIEAATEYAFNGLQGIGSGAVDSALKKFGLDISKNISNPILKTFVNYGKGTIGEGVEEVIQEALDFGARKLTYDKEAKLSLKDLGYAGLLGSFMGGVNSLPATISNTISGKRTMDAFKTTSEYVNYVVNNLADINTADNIVTGQRVAYEAQIKAIEENKSFDSEQKELAAAPYKWMVQELEKLGKTLELPSFKEAVRSNPATTETVKGGELTKAEALEKNKNITDEIRNDNTLTTAEKKDYTDPITAESIKINEMDDVRPDSGEFDDAEGIREAMEEIAAEERAEATAKFEEVKAVEEPKAETVKPEAEAVEPVTEAQPLTESAESGTIEANEVPETVNAEEVQPTVEAEPVKEVALPEDTFGEIMAEMERNSQETVENAADTEQDVPDTEQEAAAESPFKGNTLDISIKKHTKTGADLVVGKLAQRLPKEQFAELNKLVKEAGGYYSVPQQGFVFKSDDAIDKLRDVIGINDMRTAVQGAQDIQTAERMLGKESVGESATSAQAVKGSGTADVGETDSAVEAVRETVRKQAEEKSANNREAAPQDDNVIVPSAKEKADNKTVINTGDPLDMELYHGEGTPDSKKYASGINYPVLGKGTYYAFSSKAAAFYGTVTKKRVRLKKAYAIHDDHDWSVLIKEIRNKFGGWKYMLPSYQSEENAITDMENVKKYLTSQGYDGVVVQYEANSSGDYNNRTGNSKRTIEKLFGGDQVVDYNAISIDSKPVEEIEPEADKKAVMDNTVTAESLAEAETVAEQPQEAVEESKEVSPQKSKSKRKPLQIRVGDIVYLDNTAYDVLKVDMFDVELEDPTLMYPITRLESMERLPQLLRRDERNNYIFERADNDTDTKRSSNTTANIDDNTSNAKPSKEDIETAAESVTDTNSAPSRIADFVAGKLADGKPITRNELNAYAEEVYGKKLADGDIDIKDINDAMELGMNRHLLSLNGDYTVDSLLKLTGLLPTQTNRTEDQIKLQQFSTPPAIAYTAAYAANIGKNDVVLEPSAGIGGIAVFAKNDGAKVHVNELDERRLSIIKELPFDGFYNERGEQLHNILGGKFSPTVVVMNPPFSSSAVRNTKDIHEAAKHVESALKLLREGGRLVAITGRGMNMEAPAFRKWWDDIKSEYNVRANIGLDGKNYTKYGTSFDIQLIVIDKNGPTTEDVLKSKVDNVNELYNMIGEIRNERTAAEPVRPVSGTESDDVRRMVGEKAENEARNNRGTEQKAVESTLDTADKGSVSEVSDTERSAGTSTDTGRSSGKESAESGGRTVGGNESTDGRNLDEDRRGGSVSASDGESVDGRRDGGMGVLRGTDGELRGSDERNSEQSGEDDIVKRTVKQPKTELTEDKYEEYVPQTLTVKGAKKHPTKLVESAAMATVKAPEMTETLHLPKKIITDGILSDAQLEAVTRAWQSFGKTLDNGETQGYFIGDGTGVGKGREIAGIMYESFLRGQDKAVWITKGSNLLADAKRDLGAVIEGDTPILQLEGGKKLAKLDKFDKGVLFATYDTVGKEHKKNDSNLNALVNWLGKDFDGVIAFDEAHQMGNATGAKTSRGRSKPAEKAVACIELQRMLPKAKIVYVSATGATEVTNLAYAGRLGLWGMGTPFTSQEAFVSKIDAGGVAAMEVVARTLKARGKYIARNLSFDGVSYRRLTHNLDESQRETYDIAAKSWQVVIQNFNEALKVTGGNLNSKAKSNAAQRIWNSEQQFFEQLTTSMMTPALIEDARKQLEAGKSVVVQLTRTNEAQAERETANAKKNDDGTLDLNETDFSCKGILEELVKNCFPVQEYDIVIDDLGNATSKPVEDSNKNPVLNAEAVKMRDKLLAKIGLLTLPDAPIDMIYRGLGEDVVTENTGRKKRFGLDENGNTVIIKLPANKDSFVNDFQDGRKRVMIFSEAGGTGKSYHADKNAKNQQQRIHYLLQPGWKANAAVQGFGRTLRSNQASAPEYVLMTTNVPAQARFISTIARRLDQLGALTKGQSNTGSQGIFSSSDNLEGEYARMSLRTLLSTLDRETLHEMGYDNLYDKQGHLNVSSDHLTNINRFLNRLFVLPLDKQPLVYNRFVSEMENRIQIAKDSGKYSDGVENYKAKRVEVNSKTAADIDSDYGTEVDYYVLDAYDDVVFNKFDKLQTQDERFRGFYKTPRGKVRAVFSAGTIVDDKTLNKVNAYSTVSVAGRPVRLMQGDISAWTKIDADEAITLWKEETAEHPKEAKTELHVVAGDLLQVWNQLPDTNISFKRILLNDGETIIGRVIPKKELDTTLRALNLDGKKRTYTAADAVKALNDGGFVQLAGGMRIERKRVANEYRYEFSGRIAPWQMATIKNQYGLFSENIQYVNRYFIPTDKAEGIIEKLSKSYPIQEVYSAKEADAEYSLAHDGIMSDDEYVQELINNVVTPRGIEVVYDVDDSGINAWYSDTSKKLHLNPNAKHSVTSILGHEIYHSLSQEDQNKIAYFFKTNSDTDSAEFKAWKDEIFELYKKKYAEDGKPFTDPDFWREYAAMNCESLLTDKQLVERLCGKSKTLGQRILDWIKNAWYAITGKSRYTTNRAVEAGKVAEKALRKGALLFSDALGAKLNLVERQIVKSSVPEAIASDIGFGDDVGGINYSLEAGADITDTPAENTDNVTMERFDEDFESAKVVPKSDPWYTKGKNALGEMFAKLTRADSLIPEHGVEASYYAPLRRQIIRIRDNFVRSQNSSLTDIMGMMTYTDEKGKRKALSKEEANKFTRLVYLNDLAETAKIQRERGEDVRLPKEYSEEDVHRLHDELMSSLTDTERAHINEALDKRAAVWKQLTSDYIKYNRMCGFDVSNRISRQAYYRHQVIDFMTDPQGHEKRYGKVAGMHLNDGRSFLKRRTGSERDINTDFASVEFLSLQQMHFDTEVAKALAKIKAKYDMKPEFVKRAKAENQEAIEKLILREAREAMAEDMRAKGQTVKDDDIDSLEPLMTVKNGKMRYVSETYEQIMQYNRGMARSLSQLTQLALDGELDGYANTFGHRLALEQLKRGMMNETVFDFMSEFVSENDNEAAIAARVFFKNSALKRQYIEEKLGDKFMTWERIAKDEGYVIFQPREGRYSYNTNALDESAAKKLAEQIAATVAKDEAVNLSTEEWNAIISTYAKQIRVMGQPYEQWAVKPLVTQVLNKNAMEAIAAKVNSSSFVNLYLNALRHWKGWVTAGNILRAAKYHTRNIIGDLEATLTADPGIMRMVPKAYTEIRDMLKNGKETDTYREWLELGGDTNLIGIQEMTETERRKYLPMFAEDLSTPKKVIAAVTKPLDTLSKYGEDLNRARESLLRYASYLYYKDKLTKSDGKVTDFVASNRNIINGLDTIEEKAYQLSADALGNYADISEFGRQIRRGLIPFYSFTESNLRRYYRFFANPIISIAQGDSKAQNVKNLAKRMATPAVSAIILALINGVLNREADEKLPEDVRNRPHITFGEWGGNVYAFTRIGNIPELLEWVGLDDWKWTEDDWQAPIDKMWDSITPAIKVPFELATGESRYSDFDQPSAIRDRWEYLFNTFGLSDVYKGVTGKPAKNGLWDIVQNMAVYKYDTMESAYWDTIANKRNWQNQAQTSVDPTPKSNALYYMKQAIRYGEADKAKKYMREYFKEGGTGKGIVTSINTMNPYYGFTSENNKEKGDEWVASLNEIEREKLESAVSYYNSYLAIPEAYKKKLNKADNATAEALMNTYIDYVIGAQKAAGRK